MDTTDYDNKYTTMIDAEALALIGRVFDSADLQQPKVMMTALVSMLSSLLAVAAIQDSLEAKALDNEVQNLVGDVRHKTRKMHQLLLAKRKQREADTSKTVH